MNESVILKVNGMKCGECENTINGKLTALDGIKSAQASYENQEVEVDYNTDLISLNDIIQAIQDAGFEVVLE